MSLQRKKKKETDFLVTSFFFFSGTVMLKNVAVNQIYVTFKAKAFEGIFMYQIFSYAN